MNEIRITGPTEDVADQLIRALRRVTARDWIRRTTELYSLYQKENLNRMSQFNRSQLAKLSDVRALVARINSTQLYNGLFLGGGVLPEVLLPGFPKVAPEFDRNRSGIFKPEWLPGPGAFPEPHFDDGSGELELGWLLRFRNGAHGMNAGLILDKFTRYPNSPAYVLNYFQEEVALLAQQS